MADTQINENVQPELQADSTINNENNGDIAATPTAPGTDVPDQGNGQLDEGVSERTRSRFDELTKQLAEERQRSTAFEGAYKTLNSQLQQRTEVVPTQAQEPNLYDAETGLINEELLKQYQKRTETAERSAQEAQAIAKRVEQEAKQRFAKEQETLRAQEAYLAHPDLNPKNPEFNKELSEFTSSLILQSMLHPERVGGKELSFKEAGDRAKAYIAKIVGSAKADGAEELKGQLEAKDMAAVETTGSPSKAAQAQESLDQLRLQSRGNSTSAQRALMERIHRIRNS